LRRGEDHTAELVRAIARTGAGHALLLRSRPTTAQDGQGARQRRTRRIHLDGRRARAAGRRAESVIIVDDVVTTGSTLRGMHDALTDAGMQVIGAVVVAAARLPTPASGLEHVA
ncbi:MAG: ComF family protein, partial [Brachybacterium sp.]|nr:ComF family protein [Brachybacterium sp.]